MNNHKNSITRNLPALGLVLLGFTLLWAAYPHHLIMSDPWAYSQLAYSISQGTFLAENPGNIFVHRLGPTLSTGLAYKLFGVSIYTTNLSPLIAALLTLSTIWLALPSLGARLVGVALCATNLTFFKMAVNLYPDMISAAFMALSTLILVNREQYLSKRLDWIYPAGAMAALFLAFLTKLSAYWVIPLWLIVIVADLRAGRPDLFRRFYLPALLTGLLLGSLYLLFNYLAWGHPLVRLINVSGVVEAGLWAIDGPEARELMTKRLTADAVFFLLQHYGIVLIPALLALPLIPRQLRIWSYYSVITLLFFWFGSTSFTSYQPMPLVARMPLPSLPGLCILAGYFVTSITLPRLGQQKVLNTVLGLLVVATSVYSFNNYIANWQHIQWFESEAMAVISADVEANTNQQFLVISQETRSTTSLKFFFEYEYPANLELVAIAELHEKYSPQQLDAFDKIYVYQNQSMARFLNNAYGQPLYDLSGLTANTLRLYDAGGITVDLR